MIVGMVDDRAMRFRQQAAASVGEPPNRTRTPRPTPQPVAPTPPISSPTRRRGPSNPGPGISFSDALSFLNPVPSVTSAISEGRAPKGSDLALDAGLLAAGFIPFAGPGVRAAGLAARGNSALRRAAYVSDNPVVKETLAGRHFGPANLSVTHPRNVPVVDARTAGPGTYFTNGGSADSLRLRLPGDRSAEYRVPLSFRDRYKLSKSEGYAGPDDVAQAVKDLGLEGTLSPSQAIVQLNDAGFDSPVVQNLLQKGFVGFNQGKGGFPTGEFTNWLVGADDIGRINARLPQLGLRSGAANSDNITRLESILRRIVPPQ